MLKLGGEGMHLVARVLEIVRRPSNALLKAKNLYCLPQTGRDVFLNGIYYRKVRPKWLEFVLSIRKLISRV